MGIQIRVIATFVVAALLASSTVKSFVIVGNVNTPCQHQQQQSIHLQSTTQLMSNKLNDNYENNKCHHSNMKNLEQKQKDGSEMRTPMINIQQSIVKACVQLAVACTVVVSSTTSIVHADGQTDTFKFPPIDFSDKNRCLLRSSSMGQANAARDKLYDLRQCQLSGVNAIGYDLSGVIMSETDASNANFREAYFSKGFLRDSKFDGADFTNGIVDRATFKGSSLKGALFTNTVLTGTSFDGANVENADFTEAAIGTFDLRNLCKNPTLKGENPSTKTDTRASAGCI